MGTLGILHLAGEKGLLHDIEDVLKNLEQNGFRFAEGVKRRVAEESRKSKGFSRGKP